MQHNVGMQGSDYIVAINGIELRAPDNIYRLLDGPANRQTVLAVLCVVGQYYWTDILWRFIPPSDYPP